MEATEKIPSAQNSPDYGDIVTLVSEIDKNPEAFAHLRKVSLGSSDIATICGLNPYCSPLEHWGRMLGKLPEVQENDAMYLGKRLEPVVADYFAKKTGWVLESPNACWGRAKLPGFHCSIDRIGYRPSRDENKNMEKYVIEIKTTSVYNRNDWEKAGWMEPGEIPDYAHLQIIWQMGISGIHRGVVVALIGGRELVAVPVDFDQAIFDRLLQIAKGYWSSVVTVTPPAVRASDREIVTNIFGAPTLGELDLTGDTEAERVVAQLAYASDKKKAADKEVKGWKETIDAAKADIQVRSKGHTMLRIGETVVSLKEVKNSGYTVAPYSYVDIRLK